MLLKTVDWLIYGLFRLPQESPAAGMIHFFIYDTVKILFLLFVMIAVIGALRSFLPQKRLKEWLKDRGLMGNFYAALFGAVTPFCSCSSIPIFLGFMKAGAPLGVTFSFLITSPIINEYLVVLMLGFFGWKITAVYVAAGILVGVFGGWMLGKMRLERFLEHDFAGGGETNVALPAFEGFVSRVRFGVHEAVTIIRKIWIWVLIGVGIGAVIHNYVPREAIESIMKTTGVFSVPLAVLIGVPIYGSCAAIVPIAVVLFQKGVPLGTAMGFMMAVSALSLPEAIMLRRAMKLPMIGAFFLVVTVYMIIIGYLLNFLQQLLI
ncbi:MAG TPA: permease [Candidatus Bathyarchaeia archaeon]|nr:permease [Candidatus Bathyarchaeia archaeon]